MSITIHFLRHAEATHNVAAKERGDAAYNDPAFEDAPLTDTGFEQAFNTNIDIGQMDAIYCSPLRRCRQTLHSVLLGSNAFADDRIVLDDRLMEPQGHICNKRAERDVIISEVPTWNADYVKPTNPFGIFPESDNDFKRRMIAFAFERRIDTFTDDLNKTKTNSPTENKHILVVSHHEWIRTWFQIYKNIHISPSHCKVIYATI